MKDITKQQFEEIAHQQAHGLMYKIIESQPNLFPPVTPSAFNGEQMGEHLNALYDGLVTLARKNLGVEFHCVD